jgi:hypothetical protein
MTSVRSIAQKGVPSQWSSPSGRETNTNSSEKGTGFSHILSIWRVFRDSFAPLGYEDETGFHYGDRPTKGQPPLK